MPGPRINIDLLIGKKYNQYTILREGCRHVSKTDGQKSRTVVCKCDCGTIKTVAIWSLLKGDTKSCGCLGRQQTSKRMKGTSYATKHNLCGVKEYGIYRSMKGRCYNKKNKVYKNYGGRGITICDRWLESPLNFIEDMGLRPTVFHSLDRIDNNGNYCKENCRWATKKEQNLNRRSSNMILFNGKLKCVTEWAEIYGINRNLVYWRIKKGMPFEDIIKELQVKEN